MKEQNKNLSPGPIEGELVVELDTERLADWFRRQPGSRLCASAAFDRRLDVPERIRRGGMPETSCLLPPDEHNVTKYDRNPFSYGIEHGENGENELESCYVYTYAYWMGRYFGIVKAEEIRGIVITVLRRNNL